jgi:hypothetical protein
VPAPLARLPQQVAAPVPVAPSPAASPAPSPEQTYTGLGLETKIPRWLLRFIRLNLSERPKVKTFRATAWNWDSLDQGTKNSSSWLAPRKTNQKKGEGKEERHYEGIDSTKQIRGEDGEGFRGGESEDICAAGGFGREGGGGKRQRADGQRRRRFVWHLPKFLNLKYYILILLSFSEAAFEFLSNGESIFFL